MGAALAAYGYALAIVLVPHVLFELAAYSIAGGVYFATRVTRLPFTALCWAATGTTVLLLVGALSEARI